MDRSSRHIDAASQTQQYVKAVINYKARARSESHGGHAKPEYQRSSRAGAASVMSKHDEIFISEEDENKLIKDRAIITRQIMQLESKLENPINQFFNFLSPHSIANHLILLVRLF